MFLFPPSNLAGRAAQRQIDGMDRQRVLLKGADDISSFLHQATGMIPGYTQFSSGSANLVYDAVDLEGVTLLWAQGTAHCRWQDQMSDDGRVHFGFALSAEHGAKSLGRELGPSDAMLFLPGQEMDYVFLGPVETLEIGVSHEIADALGWTFSGAPLAQVPDGQLKRLERACRAATAMVSNKGGSLPSGRLEDARGEILDALEVALSPWLGRTDASLSQPFLGTARYQVLNNLDLLLSREEPEKTDLVSLSRKLGVSRRTLFYSIRQTLGLTPRQYLEIRRLNDLRDLLVSAQPEQETVTRLATGLGFGDLGRLAGRYQAQFGEYPSDTLNR